MEERRKAREQEPSLPDEISAAMLDRSARGHLRGLNKENADLVARHLVAAGVFLDDEPERAYQHAQAAARRAGRIDVVREALAYAAYYTGRYQEALREARTYRRLAGDESLRAVEADSERGLGRPEKALEIIADVDNGSISPILRTELAIVASGAHADLGHSAAGLLAVQDTLSFIRDPQMRARLLSVQADRLDELGRTEEAAQARAAIEPEEDDSEAVLFIEDTLDEDAPEDEEPDDGADVPTSQPTQVPQESAALATAFDVALTDLDGVAYSGTDPIENAAAGLTEARAAGMQIVFVTNNASRPPQQVAAQLDALGIAATPEQVFTSAHAAVELVEQRYGAGTRVLPIGGSGLAEAVEQSQLTAVDSAAAHPDVVVQGLSKELGWAELSQAVRAVAAGAHLVATNMDSILVTEDGIALGNGSLVAAVVNATGAEVVSAGKPEPGLYRSAAARAGAQRPLVVGDRLDTDIKGAAAAGYPALHVLTGISRARDVIMAPAQLRPTFLGVDLSDLVRPHPAVVADGDWWVCGQARARAADGQLELERGALTPGMAVSPDEYRALAAAAWNAGEGEVSCPELEVIR